MKRSKILIVDLDQFGIRLQEVTTMLVVEELGSIHHHGFKELSHDLQTWLVRELLEDRYLVQITNHLRSFENREFEQRVRDLYPAYEIDFSACFFPYFRSITHLPDFAIVNYTGRDVIIIDDADYKPHYRSKKFFRKTT